MIGKEFIAFVTTPSLTDDGKPKYAQLSWDSVSPVREQASDYDPFKKPNAA